MYRSSISAAESTTTDQIQKGLANILPEENKF
jgi:hypothetical protein